MDLCRPSVARLTLTSRGALGIAAAVNKSKVLGGSCSQIKVLMEEIAYASILSVFVTVAILDI